MTLEIIEKTIRDLSFGVASFTSAYGSLEEEISDDVKKFRYKNSGIDYFIVFENVGFQEISFITTTQAIPLSELISKYGLPNINYNFRDNFTKFSFDTLPENLTEFFFIKDNKISSTEQAYVETDPYGNTSRYDDVVFECFCFKIKDA